MIAIKRGPQARISSYPNQYGRLTDAFGRVHHDLRVSLTDRCSLRCSYCLPAEGVPLAPSGTLLQADEIVRLVGIATTLGINRVRLTGGEPLLRTDLVEIVAGITRLPIPPRLALTTNGIGLAQLAEPLARAGLQRVNVSLDTLNRDHFIRLTRRDRLSDVLEGLAAAQAAGLAPIKLNAVLLPGVNDDDAVDLLDWAVERDFELRFIEQMPLDGGHTWRRDQMITAAQILAKLGQTHRLTPLGGRGPAPAARWLVDDGPAVVGVIAAVTEPFCGACERLRLTADGQLRYCLFAQTESDLRQHLRDGASDADLAAIFRANVLNKWAGHAIGQADFTQPARPMSAIGG